MLQKYFRSFLVVAGLTVLLCSAIVEAAATINDSFLTVEDSPSSSSDTSLLATSQEEFGRSHVDRHMIVLTLDGSLHCVGQRTGSLLWHRKEEPLIMVKQNNVKEFLLLPNPKDGSLFAYDGEQLTKYPFSIPQLVALAPSRTMNGHLYAGSKRDVWLAINMTTGEKVETVSLERGFQTTCPAKAGADELGEIAYVGRSEYTLGVFDSVSRQKKWYGSYMDYSSHASLDVEDYDFSHLTSSTEGLLATADEATGDLLWSKDFGSPVAAIFLWNAAGLQRVPFNTFVLDALNLLVNPMGSSAALKPLSFRQRTMLLAPNIQPILFVGTSKFGTYTMPTLGIVDNPSKMLTEDDRALILAGSVEITESPDVPAGNTDAAFLQGYYTMPEKTTELTTMYPAHGDILSVYKDFPYMQAPKGLPGPNPVDETIPDANHLAGFLFYLVSLLAAVSVAAGGSFYLNRRRNIESSSTGAQTNRGHVAEHVDGSGRRTYHVGKLEFYPDAILGYGSAGTIVYEGKFDGRRVAVKRLVPELCGLAEKEAHLLRLSDKHSNVIRYFLTEHDSHFCYLALELASGTLADYVEGKIKESCPLDAQTIVEQAMHGLQHLHGLGIVHRDVKPANVLISLPESNSKKLRVMISDFGLCKRISHTSSWVAKSSSMGRTIGGTEGWIAPEILLKCFSQKENSEVAVDSKAVAVTPAVDIFSAGCLIYYALTDGNHPFGEPLRRQVNIQSGKADYFELVSLGNYTAKDLCAWMTSLDPAKRPTVNECLVHPMFWPPAKQLSFLLDVSDRLEKVQQGDGCPALSNLERGASYIVNHDWRRHVGEELQAELRTHRSYRGNSVRDLLRAIRNKKHHYQELPADVKAALGEIPDGFLSFFTSRFPRLLIHVYRSASCIGTDPPLSGYYCKNAESRFSPTSNSNSRPLSGSKTCSSTDDNVAAALQENSENAAPQGDIISVPRRLPEATPTDNMVAIPEKKSAKNRGKKEKKKG